MRKTLAALCGFFIACGIAQAQNSSGTQTLTVANAGCVSGSCVQLKFDSNDVASATISLSGSFTATVQFEASNDGLALTDANKVWVAISGTPLNGTTAVTSATTANVWKFNVASSTDIRARCSAFTSAPTVIIKSSRAVANAGGGGGSSLPALSDNGTVVTSTEVFRGPNGAASGPTYSFTNDTNSGMYINGANLVFARNGTNVLDLTASAGIGVATIATNPIGWTAGSDAVAGIDTGLMRVAAASMRQGLSNSASPIAQTFTLGESSRGGTDSNVAGASGTIKPGIGTGTGAGTKLCIQRNIMGASGSTAQSTIDGYCVGPSKTLSNTSATAQSLVNISVPSNSAGGVEGTITITCTDGTNFDAETQSFNTSFVNKAGTLTVTAPVITATSAANNSGSCTAGITAVAGTNSVDIKVTPVLTTIVPTTVTSYIAIRNNGTGNATFN